LTVTKDVFNEMKVLWNGANTNYA